MKAGSLDDTSGLKPVAHIWTARKQPWVILDETVLSYDTQPDNLKAWRDALSSGGASALLIRIFRRGEGLASGPVIGSGVAFLHRQFPPHGLCAFCEGEPFG